MNADICLCRTFHSTDSERNKTVEFVSTQLDMDKKKYTFVYKHLRVLWHKIIVSYVDSQKRRKKKSVERRI